MLLARVVAVPERVRLLRTGSSDRVVPATGIRDHGREWIAVKAAEHRASREEDVRLRGDRRLGAVAAIWIRCVKEQTVDRLVAAEVDDRDRVAALDQTGPRGSGSNLVVEVDAKRRGMAPQVPPVHAIPRAARY